MQTVNLQEATNFVAAQAVVRAASWLKNQKLLRFQPWQIRLDLPQDGSVEMSCCLTTALPYRICSLGGLRRRQAFKKQRIRQRTLFGICTGAWESVTSHAIGCKVSDCIFKLSGNWQNDALDIAWQSVIASLNWNQGYAAEMKLQGNHGSWTILEKKLILIYSSSWQGHELRHSTVWFQYVCGKKVGFAKTLLILAWTWHDEHDKIGLQKWHTIPNPMLNCSMMWSNCRVDGRIYHTRHDPCTHIREGRQGKREQHLLRFNTVWGKHLWEFEKDTYIDMFIRTLGRMWGKKTTVESSLNQCAIYRRFLWSAIRPMDLRNVSLDRMASCWWPPICESLGEMQWRNEGNICDTCIYKIYG